jgi:ABC-type dipeptide/oligopeptide/nickel transport system permease component
LITRSKLPRNASTQENEGFPSYWVNGILLTVLAVLLGLDRLSKLMDYHDRTKSTPNSALYFRASLNFLNSLLLPILAFVFANLDKVMDVIRNVAGNR